MNLLDLNPWWRTRKVREDIERGIKREIFPDIVKYIDDRQIIAIHGLRRTGKSFLMHQIIQYLLDRGIDPLNILYYSFDLGLKDLSILLDEYQEFTDIDWRRKKIYLFLDEVQKLSDWENKIKILYDTYPLIKIFISGSASLFIERKTRESLAGRVVSFKINPLTFKEFLVMKNMDINSRRIPRLEIQELISQYISSGGFPELVNIDDREKVLRYIKESIIDRAVYLDIPRTFRIDEPELLLRIAEIIFSSPGIIIDYENLARDLNRDRKTISNYVFYLEKAFLIRRVYNYSKNLLTSEKKLKKFYPSSTAFSLPYNVDQTRMIESLVVNLLDSRFFYKKKHEVDIVKTNGEVIPIEVKYKDNIKRADIQGLLSFMKTFKIRKGIVITRNHEEERKASWFKEEFTLVFVPLWKWIISH